MLIYQHGAKAEKLKKDFDFNLSIEENLQNVIGCSLVFQLKGFVATSFYVLLAVMA